MCCFANYIKFAPLEDIYLNSIAHRYTRYLMCDPRIYVMFKINTRIPAIQTQEPWNSESREINDYVCYVLHVCPIIKLNSKCENSMPPHLASCRVFSRKMYTLRAHVEFIFVIDYICKEHEIDFWSHEFDVDCIYWRRRRKVHFSNFASSAVHMNCWTSLPLARAPYRGVIPYILAIWNIWSIIPSRRVYYSASISCRSVSLNASPGLLYDVAVTFSRKPVP